MSAVGHGVQWTSRVFPRTRTVAILVVTAVALPVVLVPPSVAAATDYLLMWRSELLALPVSGSAWVSLVDTAKQSLGTADLCDQDADHHLRTLAAALVYARTGSANYGTKARAGVMAAIRTSRVGCDNATLALGRQLTAYVLAADFAGLSGTDDATFRSWLSAIRTKRLGGHSIWDSLEHTQMESPNNWGAYAGAARTAASLYLGDASDVSQSARIARGFLGDRSAYAGFGATLSSASVSWTCSGSQSTYTPVNPSCTKRSIDVDGAVVADVSRGGSLRWPPGADGISYQLESIQGLGLQLELLSRNGYPDAWDWSNQAVKRMAAFVSRAAASGGIGWNLTHASRQMPWLLNLRYGTQIPTVAPGMGRAIGFTDWLYGAGYFLGRPPVANAPVVRLTSSSSVPSSGVPVYVSWTLASSDNGVRRYQLQLRVNSGTFKSRSLSSAAARSYRTAVPAASNVVFRVRAIDWDGRIGPWVESATVRGSSISDGSSILAWSGRWQRVSGSTYLGGYAHSTKSAGATVTLSFDGASVSLVGPLGPTRGKADIYLDGAYVATVNQYRSSSVARKILFARNLADGTHTFEVQALGASSHPTVTIDGMYLLNPG
jgi:hypothetical protein